MNAAALPYLLLTAALCAETAVEKAQRDKAHWEAEGNKSRLTYCAAGKPGCTVGGTRRLMLALTPAEIESILGVPQYRMRLNKKDLHYWTIPINERGETKKVRFQVIYGDCYLRERSSKKKAVCEVNTF